jgi:hypothetical protein
MLHFLRDLLEADALGNAKELMEEFEARRKAQLKSKSGREAPNLKQGEPATVGADAQGRHRKRHREAGPRSKRRPGYQQPFQRH